MEKKIKIATKSFFVSEKSVDILNEIAINQLNPVNVQIGLENRNNQELELDQTFESLVYKYFKLHCGSLFFQCLPDLSSIFSEDPLK